MLTEEMLRKYTLVAREEWAKVDMLIQMPKQSTLADSVHGFTYTIDVAAILPGDQSCAAQIAITESDMKTSTPETYFSMLREACSRVFDYRAQFAQEYRLKHPETAPDVETL